jgi:hypothetical protein
MSFGYTATWYAFTAAYALALVCAARLASLTPPA